MATHIKEKVMYLLLDYHAFSWDDYKEDKPLKIGEARSSRNPVKLLQDAGFVIVWSEVCSIADTAVFAVLKTDKKLPSKCFKIHDTYTWDRFTEPPNLILREAHEICRTCKHCGWENETDGRTYAYCKVYHFEVDPDKNPEGWSETGERCDYEAR